MGAADWIDLPPRGLSAARYQAPLIEVLRAAAKKMKGLRISE